jgi:hypothetical protein
MHFEAKKDIFKGEQFCFVFESLLNESCSITFTSTKLLKIDFKAFKSVLRVKVTTLQNLPDIH